MVHDPEFYVGQACLELPRGTNTCFDYFVLFNGGVPEWDPMYIGDLDVGVARELGWRTTRIYASWDFAQKARFKHEVSLSLFRLLQRIVSEGNIYGELYRGDGKTVVFIWKLNVGQPYSFYLPCKIDRFGKGIFCKTMWLTEIRKAQMRKLIPLRTRQWVWM